MTYAVKHRLLFRLSVALKSKGFEKGDKLHIVCNNSIHYHALLMAVGRLGGVASCGDTALNADTIQYQGGWQFNRIFWPKKGP